MGAGGRFSLPVATPPKPSAEQLSLGEGWTHVVKGGRFIEATIASPQLSTISDAPKEA